MAVGRRVLPAVIVVLLQGCTWTNDNPVNELRKLNGLRAGASRKVNNDHGEYIDVTVDDELTLYLTGNLHETHRFVSIDVDTEAFAGVTQDGQKVRVPVSYIQSMSVEKFSGGKTALGSVLLVLVLIPLIIIAIGLAAIG